MKTIDEYLNLPYTIELLQEKDGSWFVAIKELPGCMSVGETPDEAVAMIRDAQHAWLEIALEDGMVIPEPRTEEYSGKFNLRVNKSLHRKLAEMADEEGVSLNALCVAFLAEATGEASGDKKKAQKNGPETESLETAAPKMAGPVFDMWPGLSAAARQVMLAAGMPMEAGLADERLFVTWLDTELANISSAYQQGLLQDALFRLERVVTITKIGALRSPALQALVNTFDLLQSMIRFQTSQRSVEQEMFMLTEQAIRDTNQPLQSQMASKNRSLYSAAATRTEADRANTLFNQW